MLSANNGLSCSSCAFLFSIVSGIISGVVASGLFYWYMTKMRPSLFICDGIAKETDQDGDTYYAFKVYNKSRFFDVLDLKFEVFVKTPFNSDGGQNYRMLKIDLKKGEVMLLPRCSKKNQQAASYALIITTRDKLDEIWSSDNQHIELHVHAKHSFSGASKSYSKQYYRKSTSIINGMFTFGKTNKIN